MALFLPHRLKTARKLRGLSMDTLSRRIEGLVTKQAISKYEQGKMLPSANVLNSLAQALDMPLSYFFKQNASIGQLNFRIDPRIPAKSASQMLNIAQDKIEYYLELEDLLAIPSGVCNPLQDMTIHSSEDIEAAAYHLRTQWQLGDLPIFSVYDMLESQGIKLVELEAGKISILGFTCMVNNATPLIVINLSENQTTERKRFTAIHELGHLFLQFSEEIAKEQRERFCHLFAGAVLCPASVIRRELGESRKVLALDELINLRCRYGLSIAAAVHRAKDLNIISKTYYNEIFNHYIHFNKMEEGWGKYPIEEQTNRFERLLHRCVAEKILTIDEAALYVREKPKDYKRKIVLLV